MRGLISFAKRVRHNDLVPLVRAMAGRDSPTKSAIGAQNSKLTPATAEGAVELNDGDGFALLGVHETEFRGVEAGIRS